MQKSQQITRIGNLKENAAYNAAKTRKKRVSIRGERRGYDALQRKIRRVEGGRVRRRAFSCALSAGKGADRYTVVDADRLRPCTRVQVKELFCMKVVVIRSPKALGALLKLLFFREKK